MPIKLNLDVLFDYNCQEWSPHEIGFDDSTMTIKCVTKDKLHLRLINELSQQKTEIEALKREIQRFKNNSYSDNVNIYGYKLAE